MSYSNTYFTHAIRCYTSTIKTFLLVTPINLNNAGADRVPEAFMRTMKVFTDPKALELAADKTRRRIIHLLRARELSVNQIAAEFEMTPQAIYHHVRKMLDAGLIEVAKEERVEHFIETYYRASAELFTFNIGETGGAGTKAARTREVLETLRRVGLIEGVDEEATRKFTRITERMEALEKCCKPELAEKISELDDQDFFVKQYAIEYAGNVAMSDEQFRELEKLRREAREFLKSRKAWAP